MPTALSCPTPPLYPTPRTPSSLALDKLGDHSGGAVFPRSDWQESSPPRLTGLWPVVFFLLYLARALIAGPYADSSKFLFTSTLSYTPDTIIPGLG